MIRNKSTLTELRATIDKSPALADAIRDSMSPVIARLAQRFTQMKLKSQFNAPMLHLMKRLINNLSYFISSNHLFLKTI